MFVLPPCASRLAQGAVVRHRVQTPLQTSQRLVPLYQRRQSGHCLHRGNTHTRRCLQTAKTFPRRSFHSLPSLKWKSVVRISIQQGGHSIFTARSVLTSRCDVSSHCWALITRWNICLILPLDWKRPTAKRWKQRGDCKNREIKLLTRLVCSPHG